VIPFSDIIALIDEVGVEFGVEDGVGLADLEILSVEVGIEQVRHNSPFLNRYNEKFLR